jgi:predicted glycogen debranching enzyme
MPLVFGTQICGRLDESATREWLVADGRGGYAMGTVAGLRTRRYHGLLMISGGTLADRHLGLAALDPVIELPSGAQVRLGTHEWVGGAVAPTGHLLLERFDLTDGVPRWRWRIGDVVLEREIAMTHGSPRVGLVHRLLAGGPVRLRLEALCTWRDGHHLRDAGGPPPATESTVDGVVVEGRYRVAGPGWQPGGEWYKGAYLRDEAERGLPAQEDLWYAGQFVADLDTGGSDIGGIAEVTAWAGDPALSTSQPAREIVTAARRRNAAIVAGGADPVDGRLRLAADAFIVAGPDVVAGYPWFGAWSRDTMIAYPGLFLATGRADEGRELLRRYAGTLRDGLLANTADTGQVEYNTADGTLWFVHAIDAQVQATGDADLAAELLPALETIRAAHTAGTRYGIRVDPADGLLTQGVPGEALTWMDARIDGQGVTPRIGKPVEINALWVNALRAIARLAELAGEGLGGRAADPAGGSPGPDPTAIAVQAEEAAAAFRRRYPAPTGWLYDVLDGPAGDDAALRPNQLLAYSLRYAPLRGERPAPALHRLLTPLGLRTLAPDQPGYLGRHRGGPVGRDSAYHQGTAWPWLIGPYVDAVLAAADPADPAGGNPAGGNPAGGKDGLVEGLVDGLVAHLDEYGLGSVSETADGDPPHGATGCPFQAWSVAELLRVRTAAADA